MAETNLEPVKGTTSYKVSAKPKVKPAPLDISAAQAMATYMDKVDRGKVTTPKSKLGHRRVDEKGETTYKKTPSSALMSAIQLGIGFTVGRLAAKRERDVLMQDFAQIETVWFPSEGTRETPSHKFSDFKFKSYAPVAFRFFRELFSIRPDDFLMALCNEPLVELSNPGASGSLFYVSSDDEFIIKTVQHKEAEFLQKLLPGYYLNLNQNKRTLLPKFFGLYCYQCGGKNIRLVVMNNLLPRAYKFHWKYDLKGSTYKRRASKGERAKKHPTLKDLDFLSDYAEGALLEHDTYSAVIKTIQRDCRVLESFKIMDYSMLLGIHNLDEAAREIKQHEGTLTPSGQMTSTTLGRNQLTVSMETETESKAERRASEPIDTPDRSVLQRSKSLKGREGFSSAWEAITVRESVERPFGSIPARNAKGERLLLFIGIIDILQSYRLKKKLEHGWKALVHDGDTVSVHRPSFYCRRFLEFTTNNLFKKIPGKEKSSPRKRSLSAGVSRIRSMTEADRSRAEFRRERSLTGEAESSERSRSRSFNESDRPVALDMRAQKAATIATDHFRHSDTGTGSAENYKQDRSVGDDEKKVTSISSDNIRQSEHVNDNHMGDPTTSHESVSNVPKGDTTQNLSTELIRYAQEHSMHAPEGDTTDKPVSRVHINQVRNHSDATRSKSDETLKKSGDTRNESDIPRNKLEESRNKTIESRNKLENSSASNSSETSTGNSTVETIER